MPKDCQLRSVLAKTMKDRRTTVQPVSQPMAVDNNNSNSSVLQPAPTTVATNSGSRNNIVNKVHESLPAPVLVVSVQAQLKAPGDQSDLICFNTTRTPHQGKSASRTKKDSPPLFQPWEDKPFIRRLSNPKAPSSSSHRHCLQYSNSLSHLNPSAVARSSQRAPEKQVIIDIS